MAQISTWENIKNSLFRLAAVFAELAIGVPGIIIVFDARTENRWLVLAATGVFIGISLLYAIFRRRVNRTIAYVFLITQTILTAFLLFLNPNLTFYVIWLYVLAIEAIMSLSRREGFIWLGIFIVLTVVLLVALLPPMEALVSAPIFLGGFFFFATFANATYQANVARAESQRLLEELREAHKQLQTYALQAEQLAVSVERNRLSREMHDTIGHRLTVAAVQLEGAQKLVPNDPERAQEMVATVREQVREALRELRQTVATLRKPLESDLPLKVSLEKLVSSFEEATGLTIHLLLPEDMPELSNAHRLALYRTAQEALTNVQKHAGAAQVWLQVTRQENIISLRVSDNGKGLPAETAEGYGLRGIQERAAQLGGELKLETRQGGGAQVSLWLPI